MPPRTSTFPRRSWAGCVLLLACAFGAPAPAGATVVVPVSDEALVRQASRIVVGLVDSTGPAAGDSLATDVLVDVEETLAGPAAAQVRVRVPGGVRPDGHGLRIFGAPTFRPGERVLLFLRDRPDGTTAVLHLMLGAFHEVATAGGEPLAVRSLGEARSVGGAVEVPRDFGRFARWVERRAAGAVAARDYAAPSGVGVVTAPFTLLTADGVPVRWFVFDGPNGGGEVPWLSHVHGQSGLPKGGLAQLRRALAAWTADPATPVRLRWAGKTWASAGLDPDQGPDGVNAVLFDDPFGTFEEPFDCEVGGVVARGGVWFDTDHRGSFNGHSYIVIDEADIVTNRNAGCYLAGPDGTAKNAEEIFAHELGHTLGIGHSCGDAASGSCDNFTVTEALMRAFAHGDGRGAYLGDDDLRALSALYAPLSGPPPAPSGLRALPVRPGEVWLGWTDTGAIEDGFVVERLQNGAWITAATTPANATSVVVANLPAAALVTFRVRAVNGLGSSPPSAEVQLTTLDPARCSERVDDGSFEAGTPSPVWAESSTFFGTPLCDAACDPELRTRSRTGAWWAWFGGVDAEERAVLEQEIVLEPGAAVLSFWLDNPVAATPEDVFEVRIDGDRVWGASAGDARFAAGYALVQVDLGRWTDGAPHRLSFVGTFSGSGISTFFLDDVILTACTGTDTFGCIPDDRTLCLVEDRFEARLDWSFDAESGEGAALAYSDSSGAFGLIPPSEGEVIVKVLDGRPINGAWWGFLGAASDAELDLHLRDTVSGAVRVLHRDGGSLCGVAGDALFSDPSRGGGNASRVSAPVRSPASGTAAAGPHGTGAGCHVDDLTLCLEAGRFEVRATLEIEGAPIAGHAVPTGDRTGAFWFDAEGDLELVASVVDGSSLNGHHWVLHGPATDRPYVVEVREVETGVVRTYHHAAASLCGAADFDAF